VKLFNRHNSGQLVRKLEDLTEDECLLPEFVLRKFHHSDEDFACPAGNGTGSANAPVACKQLGGGLAVDGGFAAEFSVESAPCESLSGG